MEADDFWGFCPGQQAMDIPHNVGNPPLFIKAVLHPCPLSLVMGDLTSHKRLGAVKK